MDRRKILDVAFYFLGSNENDGSHKPIIDIYNTINPLPRGYRVTYTDAWCATFVSSVFHFCGYDFPYECGCEEMIKNAKVFGWWNERDDYSPHEGDVVMYDWHDTGVGDCKGHADHVGIVLAVGDDNIMVIEGNYHDSVDVRVIKRDQRYIRGYITPPYRD